MAAVPDVTIVNGLPTAGSDTVATLSKFEKAASSGAPVASDVALAVTVRDINPNGQTTMVNSAPVVPASNWEGSVALKNFGAGEYETVAASQTDQVLGATGAVGDYLAGLLITPTTTGAGSVSIKDGNGSSIPIFNTGTLSNLVPFFVPLGMVAVNATTAGWKVTTGANVTVIGIGNFT